MNANAHFQALARYNQWANDLLYGAASALTEAQFAEDRGAFFGSVRGTLNHILVADRIWLARIENAGPRPAALDELLFEGFDDLRAARVAEDERIIRVVAEMAEERFGGVLAYRNIAGDHFELPMAQVLTHIFNHQTHHRGQAHGLLSQFGVKPPQLDFVYHLLAPR